MGIVPTPETDLARFWAKVNKELVERVVGLGPCWIWVGAIHTNGYGAFRLRGKQRLAHIVSYEWAIGMVPSGLKVLHGCDIRACVNPAHLHADTHKRNMEEMIERGRAATGLRNGAHVHGLTKLTDTEVRTIYTRARSGVSQYVLAAEYGIEQTMVSHIVRGTRWAHLLPEGHQTRPVKPRPCDDVIRAVRHMAANGASQEKIAAAFGMSQPAVSRIVNGRAYSHVM